MRRFGLSIKKDIKLFSKQVLPLFALIVAILFIFVARMYSFERGKSTLYVYIKGDTATADFLKIQAHKDNSTVVLDSKEKVVNSISVNPFSYGLDIDTKNNKVDIIIKGYESERVINNIMTMSTFLMNNSQDFSDIEINYVPAFNEQKTQKEKQVIPIFVYITATLMPFLMTFILMLEQKKIMEKNIELIFDYKNVLVSRLLISVIFHMILCISIAAFTCNTGFQILPFLVHTFLCCSISSCIGLLLSAVYNSIYNALKSMLVVFILIAFPIWNLAFGTKRYLLYLDFYFLPYKSIRDIILYKDASDINFSSIIYPAVVLLAIFIFIMMFYKKINRTLNIRL